MNPLKSLSDAMVKVMEGDYKVRAKVTGEDEFGQLQKVLMRCLTE